MNIKRLLPAVSLLLLSAVLLSTASFAWFSMNTRVSAEGFKFEAVSDSMFLEISRDGTAWSTSVDMGYDDEVPLRLVTLGHLTSGGLVISERLIEDEDKRYSSSDRTDYYMKVLSDTERSDTYEGDNYIRINEKLRDASAVGGLYNFDKGEISFSVVTDSALKFNGSGDYYNKVGNTYYKLSLPDDDGVTDKDELAEDSPLRGMYTVTLGAPEPEGERYDGSSLYYRIDDGGDISPAGSLTLGSKLNGYYTVSVLQSSVDVASGTERYYLKNTRGDYVCIGKPDAGERLSDYYYWARAYSDSMSDVGADKTLNVVKKDNLDNYYLHDTLYFRITSPEKHGRNLRIANVNIDGNDSLNPAVRLYFIATSGSGETVRAYYNNRTGEISYDDGQEALADTVLSGGRETVEVKVYIYYEGTDPSAKSENVRLSGQTVSVDFEVDYPDYQ